MNKPLTRSDFEALTTAQDLDALGLTFDCVTDEACALIGYQRTKQISRKARLAWEEGDQSVLRAQVAAKRDEIVRGAYLELYQEYLPMRDAFGQSTVGSVCDIGCGQGINNLFLEKDFKPRFTLVDIETTPEQYHFWSDEGSGYAQLAFAEALLLENGVARSRLKLVNPRKTHWNQRRARFDLVTSLYSCGFHYPVDEYLTVMLHTLETGGQICLDLRRRYLKNPSKGLSHLLAVAQVRTVYEERKSKRMLFSAL